MISTVRRERRMVARFVEAGALTPDSARSLEQVGASEGRIHRRLRDRLVLRDAGAEGYFVDLEAWEALQKRRRRHASVAMIIALAVMLGVLLFSRTAHAQPPWQEVDAIFAEWNKPSSPGCALGIFRDGKIAYERGYGMANLENDVPITPSTMFYVGSISKQFTAMAAALAISKGHLSVDDPIRKWLPELPSYADAITVRHLVHHTSGLRDYNTLLAIAGRRGDEAYDNPTVLRMTARQKGLNFPPGSEYLYSNTGYTLLAIIVERATKTPFAEFAEANIFKPLGMTATHFHTDSSRLVKERADAYVIRNRVLLDTPSNERAGAGGVFTSVRELLPWEENFYTGTVGGQAVISQLQTPGMLKNGKAITYAWGLQLGSYRGLRTVDHGGSLGGFRSHIIRFPEQHTSIVALCNTPNGPSALVRRVADVVLGGKFTERQADASAAPARAPGQSAATVKIADGAPLSDYTGVYTSDEIDATFTIEVGSPGLVLVRDTGTARLILQRRDADSFEAPGFTIRFEWNAGKVTAFRVDAGRVRDIRFARAR